MMVWNRGLPLTHERDVMIQKAFTKFIITERTPKVPLGVEYRLVFLGVAKLMIVHPSFFNLKSILLLLIINLLSKDINHKG